MKVAIVGCGKQAPKHVRGFVANGVSDIVFHDVDRDAAARLAAESGPGAGVAGNLDDVFSDRSVDAVDICTPVRFHQPLAEQAIARGKHFFCEKPLTLDPAADARLAEAASAAGVIGMVGYIYRFVPVLELAKHFCCGGLGRIHTASFRAGGRGSHAVWKHRRETGGGALNEMAVHMIDLAHWYFGPMCTVRLIESELRCPVRTIDGREVDCDADDWLLASMTSESGIRITVQADLVTAAFTQFVEIQGENGTFVGSIDPKFQSFVHLLSPWEDYPAGRSELVLPPSDFFQSQMGMFVAAVRSQSPPDRCTLADSVMVSTIQSELRLSSDASAQGGLRHTG